MIGYYVHHQGAGHLHRAVAFARACDEPVTGLSTLPRPDQWSGRWVQLPDDRTRHPADPTAGGQLHWAPLGSRGVRERAAVLSQWLSAEAPRAVVVDVSVETAALVRLHGVPVVTVVLPGRRTDPAHLLGYRLSSALVATWPEQPGLAGLSPNLPADVRRRVVHVGAVSRYCPQPPQAPRSAGARHAVVLLGRGGTPLTELDAAGLETRVPGWRWTVLGGAGEWVEDPAPFIADADVVVLEAGEGSLADVAALRRPAVVVPAVRPHEEQVVTATILAGGDWPVVVSTPADAFSPAVLESAACLSTTAWETWCDGHGAQRMVEVVRGVCTGVAA